MLIGSCDPMLCPLHVYRAGGDDGSCRHSVRQLVVNESGTFMALVGSTNISVVRLPENRGETDPITDAVPCSARRIGNVYNANGIKQVCLFGYLLLKEGRVTIKPTLIGTGGCVRIV